MILATRRNLPLRLHKLRLAGDLAEIRTGDLRFTERETREFLKASGVALSETGAAQLHQRTEGWAAGLRLAAISLASCPDPERFVAEFSGSSRTVAEYLLAEMLECQPPEVQQLLLVVDQVEFLASPAAGRSDEDIALDSDLRAVALMNLGTVEAWSLGNQDSQRHLHEGAELARRIGRPYLEVACLAELAFASKIEPFATTRRRCEEAIATAEQHGWGAEPVISPALVNLAGTLIWTGEFDEAERWLDRAARALETDTGPSLRLLLHLGTGLLMSGRRRQREALAEYSAAEQRQAQLEGSQALMGQLTGFKLTTQARLGRIGEARASLAALDADLAGSGEIGNARAVICLAEGNPADALDMVHEVVDGKAPATGYMTVVEANLLASLAHRDLGDQRAAFAAAECALDLAEADRLVLPFAMTGSIELLAAMPRHQTAHPALLAGILDLMRGSPMSPGNTSALAEIEKLSPSELRVLRYLPTNLSRSEIAGQLSVSVNTVNIHIRNIYAKLQTQDRSSAVHRAREMRLLSTGLNS